MIDKEQDTINKEVANDLYKQIKWMSLKNKVFVAGYLLEMLIDEKVFDHHGFKRLWEKYENNKNRNHGK